MNKSKMNELQKLLRLAKRRYKELQKVQEASVDFARRVAFVKDEREFTEPFRTLYRKKLQLRETFERMVPLIKLMSLDEAISFYKNDCGYNFLVQSGMLHPNGEFQSLMTRAVHLFKGLQ